ncbi:PLP-dependent transferase [Saxibacter everestensis]|uniref:PLP-dependent transferase n=1 Tax=Saxibacter everestensis TaxID=2909229 RepID=A0ABY8QXD5_9MICO|nr:PLP-dependent transferase [Brevibacteriaceae bacterium ZFBP1038]
MTHIAAGSSLYTRTVVAGRPAKVPDAPVVSPLTMSSTYVADHDSQQPPGRTYARSSQPNWEDLEATIADLESARDALVFSSGTAAMDAALSLLPAHGTVVSHRHLYAGSLVLMRDHVETRGITFMSCDFTDLAETRQTVEQAAGQGPIMVWAESSTNPMIEVLDLPSLAKITQDCGGTLVVDNTFTTPLLVRPLEHGADLVVHSVTKYLSGHSDVVAGAIAVRDEATAERLHDYRTHRGAILGPQEAWLALRGIRTLGVRLDRASQNASELAARLARHPAVAHVYHPSLPADPGHQLAKSLWSDFGGMLSFVPAGDSEQERVARADAAISRAKLLVSATSLGGVESSWERRHRHGEPGTVPAATIRISTGIEHIDDLWADIDQALSD